MNYDSLLTIIKNLKNYGYDDKNYLFDYFCITFIHKKCLEKLNNDFLKKNLKYVILVLIIFLVRFTIIWDTKCNINNKTIKSPSNVT